MKLTDGQIRTIISLYVLGENNPTNTIIRSIIFGQGNQIDWQKAWGSVAQYMPELRNAETVAKILWQGAEGL